MTAREELERVASGADADLAAMALVDLGRLHEAEGRDREAEDAYRRVAASGHPGQAPRAAFELAGLLERRGEHVEALAIHRYLLGTGLSEYAGPAVCATRRLARTAD